MQPVIWGPEGNAGEGDLQQPGFLAWAEVAPDQAQAVLGSSVVATAAWALLPGLHLPKSLHLEAAVQDHPGHALCADNTEVSRGAGVQFLGKMMKSGGTGPSWQCRGLLRLL